MAVTWSKLTRSIKYLGLVPSHSGSFAVTVDTLCKSALKALNNMLRCMSHRAGISSPDILYLFYAAIVQPVIRNRVSVVVYEEVF